MPNPQFLAMSFVACCHFGWQKNIAICCVDLDDLDDDVFVQALWLLGHAEMSANMMTSWSAIL